MKRIIASITLVVCLCTITSCKSTKFEKNSLINITDDLGNTFSVPESPRVASCYASFAECWLIAGGNLIGVTEDAISEHNLDVSKDTAIIGTVKEINIETLVAAKPDYVILSADLSAHLSIQNSLDDLGISYGYFRVDTFEDYKSMMNRFCTITNRQDLFEKNVTAVENNIEIIKAKIPDKTNKTALLIRGFSTGIKAKSDDNLAGQILKEFGVSNIADIHPSPLEDLSVEFIIKQDPDYIFMSTMGKQQAALDYFKSNIESNEAWKDLTAVKNNNFIILPKELFHYKPNNRWDKSYEYIARIIYPEIFN